MTSLSKISVDINYPQEKWNRASEVETYLRQRPNREDLFPTTFRALCEDIFAINNADQYDRHTESPEDTYLRMESGAEKDLD